MSATSRNTRNARRVMSSRLPIGVATTNNVPGMNGPRSGVGWLHPIRPEPRRNTPFGSLSVARAESRDAVRQAHGVLSHVEGRRRASLLYHWRIGVARGAAI